MQTLVFDLDGTLVHTREANLQAYRWLGVEPPDDFHVRPWQEWCDPEVHDQKGLIIARFIERHASPTPLMQVFEQTGGLILSNASPEVISALQNLLPALSRTRIVGGLVRSEKIARLRAVGGGIYFDDSVETCRLVREELPRWTAVLVGF